MPLLRSVTITCVKPITNSIPLVCDLKPDYQKQHIVWQYIAYFADSMMMDELFVGGRHLNKQEETLGRSILSRNVISLL